jgi:tetratricopeptide (TPR) repeat protein
VKNQIAGELLIVVCSLALGDSGVRAQDAAAWQRHVEGAKNAYQQKDYERSGELLRSALQEAEKFGGDDPRVAVTLHNLANLAALQGKSGEAEALYRRALALLEKARGGDHAQVAMARLGLADFLAGQGRYTEAEPDYRRALSSLEQSLGPTHLIVATVLERYAVLLRLTQRSTEAEQAESRARAIRTRAATAERRP